MIPPKRSASFFVAGLIVLVMILGIGVFCLSTSCNSQPGGGGGDDNANGTQTFTDSSTNIGFRYPTFGKDMRVRITRGDDGATRYDIQAKSAANSTYIDEIGIALIPNPSHDALTDWFASNVDENGLLVSSGAFRLVQLDNGGMAYVDAGPIPDGYDGGPVSTVYAITPASDAILSIAPSQVNDVFATPDQISNVLTQILGSISKS